MLQIQCPKCNEFFSVAEGTAHAICPNQLCPEVVHFAFFDDYQLANIFEIEHKQWYTTSIKQIVGCSKWIVTYSKENIVRYTTPKLSELLSEEILRSIQAGFADYLDGPFTLFEIISPGEYRRIEPLSKKSNSKSFHTLQESKFLHFTKFCKTIRTCELNGKLIGDIECHKTDTKIIDEILSSERTKASSHYCWSGLIDFTAPIIINGKPIGVIFTGQKRFNVRIKQDFLQDRIKRTADLLGIKYKYLLNLVNAEDVEEVDNNEIKTIEEDLNRISMQIQAYANSAYHSKREIREKEFLDSLEDIFTEAIDVVDPSPLSVLPLFEVILKQIRYFTLFPYTGIFCTNKNPTKRNHLIAGNLWSKNFDIEHFTIDTNKFCITELKHSGPLVGIPANNWLLSIINQTDKISLSIPFDNILICCVIPITSSNCEGFLVLLCQDLKQQVPADLYYINSEFGKTFLKNLGHIIGENIGLCLDISKIKQDKVDFHHLMISLGHEINTPIQSMLADSTNIVDGLQENSQLKKIAEHNVEEVNRLHLLSENIITVLSGQKKTQVLFSNHSIYRPLKEACRMFESEAASKGCNIEGPFSIGSQFPQIMMSLFDLTLAFKNLIHNAVKYSFYPVLGMDSQRFIKVIGRKPQGDDLKYIIEITNYGVGIKKEEIDNGSIFEPFYRSDLALDRYRTGSGLGLTLAKYVIEDMHNGSINVQSKSMPGSAYLNIFTVILPISQKDNKEEDAHG